jgi:hypothetical protein
MHGLHYGARKGELHARAHIGRGASSRMSLVGVEWCVAGEPRFAVLLIQRIDLPLVLATAGRCTALGIKADTERYLRDGLIEDHVTRDN